MSLGIQTKSLVANDGARARFREGTSSLVPQNPKNKSGLQPLRQRFLARIASCRSLQSHRKVGSRPPEKHRIYFPDLAARANSCPPERRTPCPPEKRLRERDFMLALTGTSRPDGTAETFPVPGPRASGVRYAPAESVPSPLTTQLSRKEFAGI